MAARTGAAPAHPYTTIAFIFLGLVPTVGPAPPTAGVGRRWVPPDVGLGLLQRERGHVLVSDL